MTRHPLPFQYGGEEKIIGSFSLRQFGWLGGGALLIYTLATRGFLLPLPLPFSMLHFVPVALISLGGAYVKYKNVHLTDYALMWWKCKKRKRVLLFQRRKRYV